MRYTRAICGLGAVVALAIPATASGHPSVYSDEAIRDANPADGPYTADLHTRHVVVNHGYTWVFRETNGLDDETTDGGVITYSRLPGDYRATIPAAQARAEGNTAAQPHATCQVASLTSTAAITGWQVGDPFYNYVPFQKASAGLDDVPLSSDPEVSDWIDDVRARTGVDLSTVSDDPDVALGQLEQRCTSIGGTFFEPDTVQNTRESMASGLLEPLEEEVETLNGALTAAQQARTAAEQALIAARAAADAANAELARVMPQLRPLTLTLATARAKARRVARRGIAVDVSGPPMRTVTVRLQVKQSRVKRLGVKSRVLAKTTVTTGVDGTAEAVLKPKRAVARALRRMRRSVAVTANAVSGDRIASARGTLTR
jgi:hypothetical protein